MVVFFIILQVGVMLMDSGWASLFGRVRYLRIKWVIAMVFFVEWRFDKGAQKAKNG